MFTRHASCAGAGRLAAIFTVQAAGRYSSQLILDRQSVRMPRPSSARSCLAGTILVPGMMSASSGEDNLRDRERDCKFG
jgi:hypothetical protein